MCFNICLKTEPMLERLLIISTWLLNNFLLSNMQKLLYEAQSNKNIQGNCKKYKPVNTYYMHK